MKPSDAGTYERARRLANQAVWTVELQRRRLNSVEPEDDEFILRRWSDFQFLIVALTRLRRAAELALKVPIIHVRMRSALVAFDKALPDLKKMRDVAEHIDEYAVDSGKDKNISRKSLEVSVTDRETWSWLGFSIDAKNALLASVALFDALTNCAPSIQPESSRSKPPTKSKGRCA